MTAISISVGIILIVGAVIAVVVWSYFRLQSVKQIGRDPIGRRAATRGPRQRRWPPWEN